MPDNRQGVPLYEGWYGKIKDKTAHTEDRNPSNNKGSCLVMMEQRSRGRQKDLNKDTPVANNNNS